MSTQLMHLWNHTAAIPFCMSCGEIDMSTTVCDPDKFASHGRISDLERQLADAQERGTAAWRWANIVAASGVVAWAELGESEAAQAEMRHELNAAAAMACINTHAPPGTTFGQCEQEVCVRRKKLIDGLPSGLLDAVREGAQALEPFAEMPCNAAPARCGACRWCLARSAGERLEQYAH